MPPHDLNSGGGDGAPFIHRRRAKPAKCSPGDQMVLSRCLIGSRWNGARHQPLTRPLVEAIETERQFLEVSEGWIFPSRIDKIAIDLSPPEAGTVEPLRCKNRDD